MSDESELPNIKYNKINKGHILYNSFILLRRIGLIYLVCYIYIYIYTYIYKYIYIYLDIFSSEIITTFTNITLILGRIFFWTSSILTICGYSKFTSSI